MNTASVQHTRLVTTTLSSSLHARRTGTKVPSDVKDDFIYRPGNVASPLTASSHSERRAVRIVCVLSWPVRHGGRMSRKHRAPATARLRSMRCPRRKKVLNCGPAGCLPVCRCLAGWLHAQYRLSLAFHLTTGKEPRRRLEGEHRGEKTILILILLDSQPQSQSHCAGSSTWGGSHRMSILPLASRPSPASASKLNPHGRQGSKRRFHSNTTRSTDRRYRDYRRQRPNPKALLRMHPPQDDGWQMISVVYPPFTIF
ncbi:hypothetical protein C8R46DRAFT_1075909 [Mycena filopes]|nr:hypothetical protein C8R46DRAFT_1075909 [Mycena filopes]